MGAFHELQSIPPQLLADGYLARAVHGERLTFAVVEVEPGAKLPEHRHHNEQFGMVVEGSVIFRIGDEERTLDAGGIWRIPSDTPTRSPPVTKAPSSSTSSPRPGKTGRLTSGSRRVNPPGRNAHRSRPSVLHATTSSAEPCLLACPSNQECPPTASGSD